EAKAISRVTDSVANVKGADPVNYLLAIKYIEGLKDMAAGKQDKTVFIPYEASGVLGSLGAVKQMFGVKA
ncbi:MAG: SPFH/Band 7/PHB domain protein, partial [Paludibacteraceae bacterium]|nr:SPFH/Band 7/PHB domain protein [Paludibacteraceae bacterium]